MTKRSAIPAIFRRWRFIPLPGNHCGAPRSILTPVLLATLTGCVAPQRHFQPRVDPASLDDVRFLHYLANLPVVTVEEGLRAMLILNGQQETQDMPYEARFAALEKIGAVKSGWRLSPKQTLTKGTLAHMLRTLCGLERGVNETLAQLTGLGDRRYALKACVEAGLMAYGLPHEPVSGGELVSAVTAAERKIPAGGADRS